MLHVFRPGVLLLQSASSRPDLGRLPKCYAVYRERPSNPKHLKTFEGASQVIFVIDFSRTSVTRVVHMCSTASTAAPGLAMEHRLAILRLLAVSIPALEDKTLCDFAYLKAELAVPVWESRVSSIIRWIATKANRWYIFPSLLCRVRRRTLLASSLVACSWSCQRLVSDGHSHSTDLDGLFFESYQVWLLNWGCFDWHMPGQRTQSFLMNFWLKEETCCLHDLVWNMLIL